MTLDTRIVVLDPVPVRALFDHCRALIGATDRHAWEHREVGILGPSPSYMMRGNQGLDDDILVEERLTIEVDVTDREPPPTLLGPDGHPIPRPVHRFGFQPAPEWSTDV